MERDNFYILLELSVDPPENDSEVIWEAIQKKKAEWSRLRNHPTKGLQAQKNIGLIPEIQRVMISMEDRQKEALAAREILKKGKESKYAEIDRHIDILMGKGYVADADIIRLSQTHGIEKNFIQDRIDAKKQEKFTRIDLGISLRMEKGYITEAEIAKIARRHAVDIEEVRKRVRCPILKNGKEEIEKPRLLDKSIEKTISENLKIIKKTSLYDFLGLAESSSLKSLHEKAALKKKALADISKKDADVTASNILVGHCMTIFKTDESRYAYDISLAKARRAFVDSDIDIAATDRKIRHEYLEILIKKAMEFGMDREEATGYIKTYCKQKRYKVEQKPEKKRRLIITAAVSAMAVVLIMILSIHLTAVHRKNTVKQEYRKLLSAVQKQPVLEKKIQLLKKYLNSDKKGKLTSDAENRIRDIEAKIATRDFNRLIEQAEELKQSGDPEKALTLYQAFLEKNPQSGLKDQADEHIKELSVLIEQKDFDHVTAVFLKGEADEKIAAIQGYLEKHPDSVHKDQAQQLIKEMSGEYYLFVEKNLARLQKDKNWQGCVNLCRSYIDIYDNSHSDQLKELLPGFEERIRFNKIFESLLQKTEQQGSNYTAAKQIFQDFLEAYPDAPIKGRVQKEMARIDGLAAIQAMGKEKAEIRTQLQSTGGRFVEKTDGVVVDTKTGLMWCILDSRITEQKTCLTYEQARSYVKNLSTGGYRDWRLPTPDQLAGIYKTPPVFPSVPNITYWTSENYTAYSDGWHTIVAAFGRENSPQWGITRRDAIECGAVRAVRNP